jgi:nitrite reductase (NO-forming)
MNTRKVLLSTVAAAALAIAGFTVPGVQAEEAAPVDITRAATDLPAPTGRSTAETVRVDLETIEVMGTLDDGTSYRYWTFNGQVPGPFVRVRVGDTVEVG